MTGAQNLASYGPYISASGAYPKAFVCGEGQGGKTREGRGRHYPWWLVDIGGDGVRVNNVGTLGYYADADDNHGLLLLGARYYNPSVGRFVTLDPIRDSLNWYVYVEANPANAVDPRGLAKKDGKKKDDRSWTCKNPKPRKFWRTCWAAKTIINYYWCMGCYNKCAAYCDDKYRYSGGKLWERCKAACLLARTLCEAEVKFKFRAQWKKKKTAESNS